MSAPSLFDPQTPHARPTDAQTSWEAAQVVTAGNESLVYAIRWLVARRAPLTAFEIADAIAGTRWSHATVRTACARAGLVAVDDCGRSPRGRKASRYRLIEGDPKP